MKVNICCLLACVLGCTVAADLIHQVAEEKQTVYLPCLHYVNGDAMWSKESEGRKVKILTVHGDRHKTHIDDRQKRYNSLVDKSLVIRGAAVSDSGRYLCNDKPAVDLTVIPSGTKIHNVRRGANITLNCSHVVGGSDVPTWSRGITGEQPISPRVKRLILTKVKPGDSGVYYCDGKPAVYLNVTKDASPGKQLPLGLLVGIGVLVPLIIIIIIIVYFVRRCRFKRREANERGHVYYEIQDGAGLRSTNGGSNQNDPTYSTISVLPQTGNKTESPYSMIGATFPAGSSQGSSQPTDNTYFSLKKPKAEGYKNDQHSYSCT